MLHPENCDTIRVQNASAIYHIGALLNFLIQAYLLLGGGRGPMFRVGAASATAATVPVVVPAVLLADGHCAARGTVDVPVAPACICRSQACFCW